MLRPLRRRPGNKSSRPSELADAKGSEPTACRLGSASQVIRGFPANSQAIHVQGNLGHSVAETLDSPRALRVNASMWPWVKIPYPPVNIPIPHIPIPTKIDSNGWCTYPQKWDPKTVLTHSHVKKTPLPPALELHVRVVGSGVEGSSFAGRVLQTFGIPRTIRQH